MSPTFTLSVEMVSVTSHFSHFVFRVIVIVRQPFADCFAHIIGFKSEHYSLKTVHTRGIIGSNSKDNGSACLPLYEPRVRFHFW